MNASVANGKMKFAGNDARNCTIGCKNCAQLRIEADRDPDRRPHERREHQQHHHAQQRQRAEHARPCPTSAEPTVVHDEMQAQRDQPRHHHDQEYPIVDAIGERRGAPARSRARSRVRVSARAARVNASPAGCRTPSRSHRARVERRRMSYTHDCGGFAPRALLEPELIRPGDQRPPEELIDRRRSRSPSSAPPSPAPANLCAVTAAATYEPMPGSVYCWFRTLIASLAAQKEPAAAEAHHPVPHQPDHAGRNFESREALPAREPVERTPLRPIRAAACAATDRTRTPCSTLDP